jgi:hypothetical protein
MTLSAHIYRKSLDILTQTPQEDSVSKKSINSPASFMRKFTRHEAAKTAKP